MEKRPIKLVLKENTVSNKDTKDGETHSFKNVLVGSLGEVELTLTLKAEKKELLEEISAPKLRDELYMAFVPNPQTTLDPEERTPAKEQKKRKPAVKKEGTEEHVVDAKYRLVEPKRIGAGSDENILNEIA